MLALHFSSSSTKKNGFRLCYYSNPRPLAQYRTKPSVGLSWFPATYFKSSFRISYSQFPFPTPLLPIHRSLFTGAYFQVPISSPLYIYSYLFLFPIPSFRFLGLFSTEVTQQSSDCEMWALQHLLYYYSLVLQLYGLCL